MNITFEEVEHKYIDSDTGRQIPSVTQILSGVYGSGLEDAPSFYVNRAAEKGTKIHREIERYIKEGIVGETPEFRAFLKWAKDCNFTPKNCQSEIILYSETASGDFCGTCDLVFDGYVWDFKTAKILNKIKASQQLSFYKYSLEQKGIKIKGIKAIHLVGENYQVVDLPIQDDSFILETIQAFKTGEKPIKELATISKNEISKLYAMIGQIELLKKASEEIKSKIKEEMETRRILNITIDDLSISYIGNSKRKALDSTKLKAEMPEVFEKYQKESDVKSSIRITRSK